jgi:hypothetical protein
VVLIGLWQNVLGYSLEKVPIRKRSPQYTTVDVSQQPGYSSYLPALVPSRVPSVGSGVSVAVDQYPDYDYDYGYGYGYDQLNPYPYGYNRRPYYKRESRPQEVEVTVSRDVPQAPQLTMLTEETEIQPDILIANVPSDQYGETLVML